MLPRSSTLSNAIWRRNPSELRVARSDGCVDSSKQLSAAGWESRVFYDVREARVEIVRIFHKAETRAFYKE